MIYAAPGDTFTAIVEGLGATTPGVRIEKSDGTNHTPRTTSGVVSLEAGSGVYAKHDLIAPTSAGTYIVAWDTGGAWYTEELVVTFSVPDAVGAAAPHYTTPAALRAELGLTAGELPDADAIELIADAEDRVDRLLGARVVFTDGDYAGRKVDPTEELDFAVERLSRATVLLAAAAHRSPAAFQTAAYDEVTGPDFAYKRGEAAGPAAAATAVVIPILAASGLRRLTARAGA